LVEPSSEEERRALGWRIFEKVIEPVAVDQRSVPRWRTFYSKEEFVRMFQKLYTDLGRDGRMERRPFGDRAIEQAFEWNASGEDLEERMFDQEQLDGLGGNARVGYAGSVLAHLFATYAASLEDRPILEEDPCAERFGTTFGAEMPGDAVLIKTSWHRADFGETMPVFDTSPERMKHRLDGDGDWGSGDGVAAPNSDRIYTVELPNGNRFRLAALHVMTKELSHWVWTSFWWSNDPSSDFGGDRPASIGGPWSSYKMCIATSFDGWCSNPYLEEGKHNARTNCIGCHQHGGADLDPEEILALPDHGNGQARRTFPTDYLWAFDRGDSLKSAMQAEIDHHASLD
jgi:hypothetical protein